MSLRLLLEGESLLNDASSITLFTIFLSEVKDYRNHITANGGQVLGSIVSQMLLLAVGEFLAKRISPLVPNNCFHLSAVHMVACRTQKYDVCCRLYSLCEREVCCYYETGLALLMGYNQGPHLSFDLATKCYAGACWVSSSKLRFPAWRRGCSDRVGIWGSDAVCAALDAAWWRGH